MKKILFRLAVISAFALAIYGISNMVSDNSLYQVSHDETTDVIKMGRKPILKGERDDDPDEGHMS